VALTGGIASGKSTVAELFAAQGVAIIDADVIAREVVATGTPLLQALYEQFGTQLRRSDGSLDRAALRRRVFADAAQRQRLEALVQPAIRARCEELARVAAGPYVLFVIPLLAETGGKARFGRVLVVDCPEALQLQRLQARDGCDPQQARAMLAAQATRSQRLAIADDVIVNDGDREQLQAEVAVLNRRYQELAVALGARS
jgi:dephospho-CoA kinase